MADIDESRPSTQERYQRAVLSSDLKPTRCGTTGDIDIIGAAGMVPETLGMMLFRLVGEWDACKGEKALYEAEAARLYELQRQSAKELQGLKRAPKPAPSEIKRVENEHRRLGDEARREVMTGRAMVLVQMKSLASVKQEIGRFAYSLARSYPRFADAALMALTGRALDVFLDPTCPQCDGRGFNGGAHRGEKPVICRPCHGSGHRRDDLGKTPDERHFAGKLLVELSRKMTEAEKQLRAGLRSE